MQRASLIALKKDSDGMQEAINQNILQIIDLFCDQGHSGFSGSYVISILERLLRFKPLTPLTGEEDEWNEPYGADGTRQNKRCSSVFLNANGTAHDIDAVSVSDNGGITWFAAHDFQKEITFPYTPPIHPERVFIEYTDDTPPGFISDNYEIITDQPDRIRVLYERKRKEFDDEE